MFKVIRNILYELSTVYEKKRIVQRSGDNRNTLTFYSIDYIKKCYFFLGIFIYLQEKSTKRLET